jgi:GTP-binding protein
MLPVIAIVGRPNVGKSTLFNCLTRSRDALVADTAGVTRDRHYGLGRTDSGAFVVVDTGGFCAPTDDISKLVTAQTLRAVQEADLVLLMVDGRAGLNAEDEAIAQSLRRLDKRIFLAVNKMEHGDASADLSEFHALALGTPHAISATHRRGVAELMHEALASVEDPRSNREHAAGGTRVAVVGRPNTGKSTLVNRLLGEDRLVAHDTPGTTHDAVEVTFQRGSTCYTLVDTAGVRRRSRVVDQVEKFSVVKTLQAIASCSVVIVLMDAREGISDQDLHVLGLALEQGCGLVIAVNKWDNLSSEQRSRVRQTLERKLGFVDYAPTHFISALHGGGIGELFRSVDRTWASANVDVSTSRLTRLLHEAVKRHPPPLVRGRRIKLRYAHQGGANPPVFIIHGNQTDALPRAYQRYLARVFRTELDLTGTPLRLEFKTSDNPFRFKRQNLSRRQVRKRKRLIRHAHDRR